MCWKETTSFYYNNAVHMQSSVVLWKTFRTTIKAINLPCRVACWAGTQRSRDKWAATLSLWTQCLDCSSLVACTVRKFRLVTLRGWSPRRLSTGWFALRCLVLCHLWYIYRGPVNHNITCVNWKTEFKRKWSWYFKPYIINEINHILHDKIT